MAKRQTIRMLFLNWQSSRFPQRLQRFWLTPTFFRLLFASYPVETPAKKEAEKDEGKAEEQDQTISILQKFKPPQTRLWRADDIRSFVL